MVIVRKRKRSRHRGVTTVEAALVFPILVLLTFGAIEYGWLFLKAQQITNATRYGARIAIRPDSTTQDVIDAIDGLMTAGGMGTSGYVVTISPADVSFPAVGEAVVVNVNVPCANIILMDIPLLLPTPTNIAAEVTMGKEGP
jgi:Flp pilus assembly protein TadG